MAEALTRGHAEDVLAMATPVFVGGAYTRQLDDEARQRLRSTSASWLLEEGSLENFAQSVLERVWAQQRADGGWGRCGGEDSEALATAAVLDCLATLEPLALASYPEKRIQRAVKRLKEFQAMQRTRLEGSKNKIATPDTLDAYVYLTLLTHGSDNSAMRNILFRNWKKLTTLGKTILAQALHLRGDTEDRNTIRFFLGEKLVKNEETGAIQLKADNEKFWWTWYGSGVELQARYLDFLVCVKGDAPVTDAAALQLLSTRKRPGFWGSARDSGQALVALLRYGRLKKATPGRPKAQHFALWQGDRKILESVTNSESGWNAHALALSGNDLVEAAGTEESADLTTPPLRLVYAGANPVGVHAHLMVVRQPTLIREHRGDLFIGRRYARASSSGDAEILTAGEDVAIGDTIEVVLTFGSTRQIDHLSLTDFLPSGFEIVGELPSGWTIQDGGIGACLPTLESETEIRYRIKAVTRGQFRALPARLSSIYLARLEARSEEMILLVK